MLKIHLLISASDPEIRVRQKGSRRKLFTILLSNLICVLCDADGWFLIVNCLMIIITDAALKHGVYRVSNAEERSGG